MQKRREKVEKMSHIKADITVQTFFVLVFIQAALINVHYCSKADVIKTCINVSPCIATYTNIYNALASADDNINNIESALYPATKPSSVRVFVNVFGPNKTGNSTTDTKYTWSLNCLYAAFPANVLEVLSLGSILVESRTQELNITIPHFCCSVSVEKREKMIKDVLAALQDLAVSPSIRDPRLNSAECVTKDHKPDIMATGRSAQIIAILCCSFVSVLIIGPLLAFYALDYLNVITENCDDYCACCAREESANEETGCLRCCKREKPMILSVNYVCHLLLIVEFVLIIYVAVSLSFYKFFSLFGIIFEGLLICRIQMIIYTMQCCTKCQEFCKNTQSNSIYRRVVFVASANVALYHLFWIIIGIMINPTWGLTVLLVVCFVIVALFYAVFMICDVDKCCSSLFIQRFSIFSAGFLGLCLAAVVPVLAGQSFYGRETADDILKTALLYVINFLGLWIYRNRNPPTSSPTVTTATQTAPPPSFATSPFHAPHSSPAPSSAPAPDPTPLSALGPPQNDEVEHVEEARPFLSTKV